MTHMKNITEVRHEANKENQKKNYTESFTLV